MVVQTSKAKSVSREDIIEVTRNWLGTPYVHQACKIGIGCDCLGLLRGVWKTIYGEEAEKPPNYTSTWAETNLHNEEPMLEAAKKHLVQISFASIKPADVLLIRIRNRSSIKHCGIFTEDNKIIHAYDRHSVVEEPIRDSWKLRDLYAFQFPGVVD